MPELCAHALFNSFSHADYFLVRPLRHAAGYGPRDDSSGAGIRHGGRGVVRGSHRQAAGHAVLRGALPDVRGTGRGHLGSPVPTTVLRGLRRLQGVTWMLELGSDCCCPGKRLEGTPTYVGRDFFFFFCCVVFGCAKASFLADL